MPRQLYADPTGKFVHQVVLDACQRAGDHIVIVDTSLSPYRRISGSEYVSLVEQVARGFVAAGIRPGEVIAVFLANSWEYAVAYHAATLAGAIATPLNPTYQEREARYQLECSGAAILVTDGIQIANINLQGLPALRRVYTTRHPVPGTQTFDELLRPTSSTVPKPDQDPRITLAALPFSSGTTGLPKGVMLTHANLVTNVYQTLTKGEEHCFTVDEIMLDFLPLYHIYGLTVCLNLILTLGATLVLMPRFDLECAMRLIVQEGITTIPCVPAVINAFAAAAEKGVFPKEHSVKWVKSGAAPLSAELARRFPKLTGIKIRQGYGMTEASPVTHIGFIDEERYLPQSIGQPVAQTDCRIIGDDGKEVADGEIGELVMRGPQFMLGYWKAPEATDAVLRDGWYWSGDVARRDERGFYFIVDRRKEMIKYKGFPVAPAEVEAILMEHPSVRDCGVVGRSDEAAGEIPFAFVVLREGGPGSDELKSELGRFVADRLTHYKQPRGFEFVSTIPRNPSGKILRRELRKLL
jgi:acyl-CoA synthetase (AMP-forming)/AMP-acid ligase II